MRIAQIAPLHESVPPQGYGGTERVVSYLTEALVRDGHEVTLFASGDSVTRARLVPCARRSLRLDRKCTDRLAQHVLMLERVVQRAGQFDVLHFHVDYLHFSLSRRVPVAQLTTLHGRLDLPELAPLFAEFGEMPLVSISDAQRTPLAAANWLGTVYHGLPRDLHTFRDEPGRYLAFLGRISPEKRVDRAIRIARAAGVPLRIAAKVDAANHEYFEAVIAPMLREPGVEFLGEVGGREKDDFLGDARALLFPIDWPEPFGLVMIEAMACGTPVIAYPRGSVREVMSHGDTGFIVSSVDEAVAAVRRLDSFDRHRCRKIFEARFTDTRMAAAYVRLYEQLLFQAPSPFGLVAGASATTPAVA